METVEIMKAYEYESLGGLIQAIPVSDVARFCRRIENRLHDIENGMDVQQLREEIRQILLKFWRYFHHAQKPTVKGQNRLTMNRNLKLAMARYFRNCHAAIKVKPVKWDKLADLKHIENVAAKSNYAFQASAGTFWFTRNGKTTECNESNYLGT